MRTVIHQCRAIVRWCTDTHITLILERGDRIRSSATPSVIDKVRGKWRPLVDVVLEHRLNGDTIVSSEVESLDVVENLSAEDEIARWRAWFRQNCRAWDAVEDVESSLGLKPIRRR